MARISVVILTNKSNEDLRDLYTMLFAQTSSDFEVIVAREPGIVNAMNAALKNATGEIFVRIDDDVSLPHDWLENLTRPFLDKSIVGVTGPTYVRKQYRKNRDSIRAAEKPNWFLRWMFDGKPYALAKIYKCGSVSYGSNYQERVEWNFDYASPDHLEGTNWAMRTDLIRRVGGFDPKFDGVSEWFDTDVEQKIKKLGFPYGFIYVRKAFLWHNVAQGTHYRERFEGFGRLKNWLRFHVRHSEFHYKKVIWFLMMTGYVLCGLFRR